MLVEKDHSSQTRQYAQYAQPAIRRGMNLKQGEEWDELSKASETSRLGERQDTLVHEKEYQFASPKTSK